MISGHTFPSALRLPQCSLRWTLGPQSSTAWPGGPIAPLCSGTTIRRVLQLHTLVPPVPPPPVRVCGWTWEAWDSKTFSLDQSTLLCSVFWVHLSHPLCTVYLQWRPHQIEDVAHSCLPLGSMNLCAGHISR